MSWLVLEERRLDLVEPLLDPLERRLEGGEPAIDDVQDEAMRGRLAARLPGLGRAPLLLQRREERQRLPVNRDDEVGPREDGHLPRHLVHRGAVRRRFGVEDADDDEMRSGNFSNLGRCSGSRQSRTEVVWSP